MDFCTVRCDSVKNLLSHLKGHIREGRTVSCPFRNCDKRFIVVSTFSSHLSRTHQKYLVRDVSSFSTSDSGAVAQAECLGEQAESMNMHDNVLDDADRENKQSDVFPERSDKSLFLNSLALFYLKLLAKLLLPSSVIQDMQDMHDISQSHLFYKLKENLVTLDFSDVDLKSIVDALKSEDLFHACNTGPLKTDKRRKSVFKSQFRYVEPVPICLGQNESGKECFAQMSLFQRHSGHSFSVHQSGNKCMPIRRRYFPQLELRSHWRIYGMVAMLQNMCCFSLIQSRWA